LAGLPRYPRTVDEEASATNVSTALAILRQALDSIDAMTDSPAKRAAIRELAGALSDLDLAAAAIRKGMMRRLWQSQETSLGVLGQMHGVSKARAKQVTDGIPKYPGKES